ncbi:MAG: hypothetical protein GXP53_13665 [Deltaproteobacteria bacterium]|nr:hypothetical protein [Deltaproteobacteria bacterium]
MKHAVGPVIAVVFIIAAVCGPSMPALSADFIQVPAVIHIHTTFSSGSYTIDELVEKAAAEGIGCLVLTDHDRVEMEYGLFPFRNIVKAWESRPSVLSAGAGKYLDAIFTVNARQKNVLVIPGVQSSPFYYWTGIPLPGKLTAHDFRKELLILGMDSPGDYRGLPIMNNGPSLRYTMELLPGFLAFAAAFAGFLLLSRYPGHAGRFGMVLAVFSFLLMIDNLPFKSSLYDAYHGDRGIAPFQEEIDYANQHGGLVFWAHPESNYSPKGRSFGPIRLETPPYTDALFDSDNYTGFSAIYGDEITFTTPGAGWDQLLAAFCRGERKRPPVGIAGADFHMEYGGEKLDTYQTVCLVHEKSARQILDSLARGRCYALFKKKGACMVLDRFGLADEKSGRTAVMGQILTAVGGSVISGRISASDNGRYPIRLRLVCDGRVVREISDETPVVFSTLFPKTTGQPLAFCRLDAESPALGRLLSNPVFVKLNGLGKSPSAALREP